METIGENHLSEVEEILKKKFNKEDKSFRVQSNVSAPAAPPRMDQLILPLEERPLMPFTKDKFLIRENPKLVAWERELRRFLAKLSVDHGHRISAVMVYEWATGIKVADLIQITNETGKKNSATPDLRLLNKLLREYFGKSYSTYILGRKVPNAYKVPIGHYVRRKAPKTLTLYAEYAEGTLYP